MNHSRYLVLILFHVSSVVQGATDDPCPGLVHLGATASLNPFESALPALASDLASRLNPATGTGYAVLDSPAPFSEGEKQVLLDTAKAAAIGTNSRLRLDTAEWANFERTLVAAGQSDLVKKLQSRIEFGLKLIKAGDSLPGQPTRSIRPIYSELRWTDQKLHEMPGADAHVDYGAYLTEQETFLGDGIVLKDGNNWEAVATDKIAILTGSLRQNDQLPGKMGTLHASPAIVRPRFILITFYQ